MTNNSINHDVYLGKLKKIQEEKNWFKHYLHLNKKPNVWTIIEYGIVENAKQRSAHEVKISKMIRWLMDPNETHQLGNIFAQKFVDLLGGQYTYSPERNNAITSVTEFKRIDVFYKDTAQKMCIAIEVKQFDEEIIYKDGTSQLDHYEKVVKKLENNEGLQPYYIFLTPLKKDPTNENWIPIGYQELIDIIDDVYNTHIVTATHDYVEEIKFIVKDFREELERSMELKSEETSTYINKELTYEEKKYTVQLAKEIRSDSESLLWKQLIENNDDETLKLKEVVLFTRDHLQLQDKTPNEEIRILIRKIYNYLSGDKALDLDLDKDYSVKESETILHPELIETYELDFRTIYLTQGKSQGMYIEHENNKCRIYLSGDTHGAFPNDFIHLLPKPNPDEKRLDANHVKKGQFILNNNTILEDKVTDKNGNEITFDQLMEVHVMPAIRELNNRVNELKNK